MTDREFVVENPNGFFVYILWGDNPEQPLYVGQSTNVFHRLGTHMMDPEKRALTQSVQLIRCDTQVEMWDTEMRLIAHLQPLLNIQSRLYPRICTHESGCPNRSVARGLCGKHLAYERYQRPDGTWQLRRVGSR